MSAHRTKAAHGDRTCPNASRTLGRHVGELCADGQPHSEQAALKRRASCRGKKRGPFTDGGEGAARTRENVPQRCSGMRPTDAATKPTPHAHGPSYSAWMSARLSSLSSTCGEERRRRRRRETSEHPAAGRWRQPAPVCTRWRASPVPPRLDQPSGRPTLTPSMALACRSFRSRASLDCAAAESCSILHRPQWGPQRLLERDKRARRQLGVWGRG